MSDISCFKALINGQVQGVFFRASTRDVARQLGISGYARNLADGRVEALACGKAQELDELARWLHQGPPQAEVSGVDIREVECQPPLGFEIG